MAFLPGRRQKKDLDPAPSLNDHIVPYPVPPGMVGKPYRDSWDLLRAVDQGFNASIWVNRAVTVIAGNQARLPMIMRKGNPVDGKEVPHQYLEAFNFKSSTYYAANLFRKQISMITQLNRQGCMVEVVKSKGGDLLALYILPPGYTWPIPNEQTFTSAFRVQYPGKAWFDVPSEYVVWIREPHPTDMYLGNSPLMAAGLDVEIDWFARQYNRNFLMNDGRPGGLLLIQGGMDEVVAAQLRQRFYGGTGGGITGAGRLTVMEAEDAQYLDVSQSARDAQYIEGRQETMKNIAMAFGVPMSMMGDASGRTYDNADAERDIFWRETMLPHLETLARAFDDLTPEPDLFFGFDLQRVEVLQREVRTAQQQELAEVQAEVRTIDEYRVKQGLKALGGGAAQLRAASNLAPITGTDETGNAKGGTPGQVQGMPISASGQTGMPGMPQGQPEPQTLGPDGKPVPPGFKPPDGMKLTQGPPPPPKPEIPARPFTPVPPKKPLATAADDPDTPSADISIDEAWARPLAETKAKDTNKDGIMVAIYPPPEIAKRMAVKGGLPPESLHVTLAYLGKASDYTPAELQLLAKVVEAVTKGAAPFQTEVTGSGQFTPSKGSDGKVPHIGLVSSTPLLELRQRLKKALEVNGLLDAS